LEEQVEGKLPFAFVGVVCNFLSGKTYLLVVHPVAILKHEDIRL
jgi:hypothetical protein